MIIGSRVFIGAGSIILPGARIGDDVVIGAGSIVTGNIAAGKVAVGNPAREVDTTTAYLARKQQEMVASMAASSATQSDIRYID